MFCLSLSNLEFGPSQVMIWSLLFVAVLDAIRVRPRNFLSVIQGG